MTITSNRITTSTGTSTTRLLQPFELNGLHLSNRLVVSPMCQYSCEAGDGLATDWHLVHLGSRAVGRAGLIITEAAAVTPEGRISPQDLGFWSDAHADALARTIAFVKSQGTPLGIQLAHAGRKASTRRPWEGGGGVSDADGGWTPIAPSPIAFTDTYRAPRAMERADIDRVVTAFADAAERSLAAGFDLIELHAAHGYLLHQFLSPLSNQRTDEYGGSFDNRVRLLIDVVDAVRQSWPQPRPLVVRVSATDWVDGGWDLEETVRLARVLKQHGVDLIDCSTGGLSAAQRIALAPGYQVTFADRIRAEAGIATGAVGLITSASQAEDILARGQADLILMAREFLRQPYVPLHAAIELGDPDAVAWPAQYERAKPSPRRP